MAELVLIALALGVAGLVKGLVGLGLPPIAMGALVLILPPVEAAATVVIPALATNLWQGVAGAALKPLLHRFRWLLLGTVLGTLAFAGALSGQSTRAMLGLGTLLLAYGIYGLTTPQLTLSKPMERALGPVAGVLAGVVTAFTGVAALGIPFLQATGLPREKLVQALGLYFTTAAIALMVALGVSGGFDAVGPVQIALATTAALLGMSLGARFRKRIPEATFRTLIFWLLAALGLWILIGA